VLRGSFCNHAVASMQRVDTRLSQLDLDVRASLEAAGILTYLNFTAKQLRAALEAPLAHAKLLGIEETEYDDAPEGLTELRAETWSKFGALALDDVKPTLDEVEAHLGAPLACRPPLAPDGRPFKALQRTYNHGLSCARRFIADYVCAKRRHPSAQGELKLDEEFCCYLIGVGHAPFARSAMAAWRRENMEVSMAIREMGVQLIEQALAAGMAICLEVTFADEDVQWLLEAVPALEGRLFKQGGLSGSAALPQSLVEVDLLSPKTSSCCLSPPSSAGSP